MCWGKAVFFCSVKSATQAVAMVHADYSAQADDVVLLAPPNADDILGDEEEGDSCNPSLDGG